MTDDSDDAPRGVAPKLTIGQRLLTALPNLQRQRTPAPPTEAPRTNGSATTANDADADGGDDGTEDDSGSAPSGPATRGGRFRDALVKPAPPKRAGAADPLADMSREEIAHRIKKLDDRERQMALLSAPIGVVVGIVLTGFALHLNPAANVKGHTSSSLILLEGGVRILLSGVVAAAAVTRRRSLVGFSLLFLGTAMGSPLFALPFWGLGGYLIWRVFKYQKALNTRGGAAARAGGRPTGRSSTSSRVPANPRAAARAGSAAGRTRAQAARQRGRKQPEPAGPTPSKRYTPPKPTRPRPQAPPT